jgi:glycosyltransferase involved in cell wall biosynthesis
MLMSREATERLTNATKEAMASGCVCVVTRSPGIEELMADGVHGILVEQGDVDAAARAMAWAFEHTAEAAEMRAAAARRIQSFFDVVRGMDVYRQRWLDLSEARRTGAARDSARVPCDGPAVPLAERS